jgi:hypothetical protein
MIMRRIVAALSAALAVVSIFTVLAFNQHKPSGTSVSHSPTATTSAPTTRTS